MIDHMSGLFQNNKHFEMSQLACDSAFTLTSACLGRCCPFLQSLTVKGLFPEIVHWLAACAGDEALIEATQALPYRQESTTGCELQQRAVSDCRPVLRCLEQSCQ